MLFIVFNTGLQDVFIDMVASHATEVLNHSNTVLPQESQLCIVKRGAMKFRTKKDKAFHKNSTHRNNPLYRGTQKVLLCVGTSQSCI